MSRKEKQEALREALFLQSYGEYEGLVVEDLAEIPRGYRGHALQVNDHGNITLWACFKRGTCREIASML